MKWRRGKNQKKRNFAIQEKMKAKSIVKYSSGTFAKIREGVSKRFFEKG